MASFQKVPGKKGLRWKAVIRRRGFDTQTQTFGRKKDAETWATAIEAKIDNGSLLVSNETRRITVGQLIDRYIKEVIPQKKSGNVQKQQLIRWKELLGDVKLYALTTNRILQARSIIAEQKTRYGKPVSNATVNRYHAALGHALKVAEMQYGWIERNPMRKVPKLKEPQGRVRYLEEEELSRLMNACSKSTNKFLFIIVLIAVTTGMRKSEILNLKWSDVNLDRGIAVIEEPKNGQRRSAPLLPQIAEKLHAVKEEISQKSVYLFPGRSNLNPIDIKSSWYRAIAEAQVEDFRFHDLRHTAASYLAMDGASVPQLAAVLGHRSHQMAARYAHLSDASIHGIIEKTMSKRIKSYE
ncbi:MAG: site-specific integrase [Rhodobacteraceae bacterium]|nr:site-specific integrase [Paracoccaceae bacterium]